MAESIIVALITGGLALLGTIITVRAANNKTQEEMRQSQAIMRTEITELTREVREHNGFARRMPVLEEQIKVANHRIRDIESVINH